MRKKTLKILLTLIIAVFLFIGLLLFLVFSTNSVKPKLESLDYTAWFSANRKIDEEVKYLNEREDLTTRRALVFSKQEVNSLFYMLITARKTYGGNNQDNYNIENIFFDGRNFVADIVISLKYGTPFGRDLRLHVEFFPCITNNELSFDIKCFRLGRLPISSSVINYIIASRYRQIRSNPMVKRLLLAVKVFQVEDNSIIIQYIPEDMLLLLSR